MIEAADFMELIFSFLLIVLHSSGSYPKSSDLITTFYEVEFQTHGRRSVNS